MEKIAFYKEEIEKVAQAKWRKLIDSAKDTKVLSNTMSEFNRNKRLKGWESPVDDSGIGNKALSFLDKKKSVKQYLSDYNQRHLKLPFMRQKVSELSPENKNIRLNSILDRRDDKAIYARKRNNKPMDVQTSKSDPEEYVDIIHGTNRAKAEAFLKGGNGASKTESSMRLDNGKVTDMGIQVHNKVRDRASGYAHMQSDVRGGDSVSLEGKIKRKYLYPNASRGSAGFGDEYGLPSEHYNKIKDGIIKQV